MRREVENGEGLSEAAEKTEVVGSSLMVMRKTMEEDKVEP
jgi:hypothetical protein